MKSKLIQNLTLATLAILGIQTASAHLGYTGRDFGTFSANGFESPISLSGSTQLYGWADGTDSDFGDSHKLKAFRFNLQNAGYITLTVQATGTGNPFLPGFSIFSGLAHLSPASADHDPALASLAYLATLGSGPYEGSYQSMNNWAIGNDTGDLSYFTYIGHAADGTSANYGSASGINGDGLADGFVTASFWLPAGDYSVFVGGASYSAEQVSTAGFSVNLQVVPEPSSYLLLVGVGAIALLKSRRRRII